MRAWRHPMSSVRPASVDQPGSGRPSVAVVGARPSSPPVGEIVRAVRDGDDAAVRTLLADLAAVADTAALLYLRECLYATQ